MQVDPPTLKNVSITHLIILASQIDSIIPLNLTTDRSLDPGATIDSNSAWKYTGMKKWKVLPTLS